MKDDIEASSNECIGQADTRTQDNNAGEQGQSDGNQNSLNEDELTKQEPPSYIQTTGRTCVSNLNTEILASRDTMALKHSNSHCNRMMTGPIRNIQLLWLMIAKSVASTLRTIWNTLQMWTLTVALRGFILNIWPLWWLLMVNMTRMHPTLMKLPEPQCTLLNSID
jgi:hypothetical protein